MNLEEARMRRAARFTPLRISRVEGQVIPRFVNGAQPHHQEIGHHLTADSSIKASAEPGSSPSSGARVCLGVLSGTPYPRKLA